MSMHTTRLNRQLACWMTSCAAALILIAGCGKDEHQATGDKQAGGTKPSSDTKPQAQANAAINSQPRLHQPMKDAVSFDPPDNQLRPPDETFGKKNVAKIYDAIVGKDGLGGLWEQVHFVSAEGKRLSYTATLKTDEGEVVIELWPDAAPNHVRNFIALARAGYYDGLPFHRAVNQKLDGKVLTYLEGGCPKGTGEIGYGSIGYWLKPELSETLHHEEGTVGAWHDEIMESAACKFYITLGQVPWMDRHYTIFGKVIQGLDVAQRIHKRPVAEEDRPREPVVIHHVTIQVREETLVASRHE